ncbi:MAG: PAS domain-containing protein [Methanomicrobiales archaeon]|nr:PAS domain-containing protein [Methanomicrobiales archaeon]
MNPPHATEHAGTGALSAAVICLIFLVCGASWILAMAVLQPSGTWSDWLFLILAAVLLYVLIRYSLGRLRKSEDRYRNLVEQAGSIILTMDHDGKITFFNRYAEELFGFPRGEVLGASVIGTIVPATESSGRDLDRMMQLLLSTPGRFLKNRNENVTAEGRRVTVLWSNHALFDRDGNVNSVLSVGTDLPEEPPAPDDPPAASEPPAPGEPPADEDDDSIFF